MTALSISSYIYTQLTASAALRSLVSGKVFSVVTLNETTYPFIVYERGDIGCVETKDGTSKDIASVRIGVCSNNYANSVQIAEVVRKTLEAAAPVNADGCVIAGCKMSKASEDFQADAFIQVLEFNVEVFIN